MSVDSGGADILEPVPAAAPETQRQTPGGLLRHGREQRGLTVQQIADELHLDVRLVQAIEADNFLSLGAPVYAKGHLRKYASVLGLAPHQVIALYETLSDVPAAPSVVPVMTSQPPPRRISLRIPALIVAGLLVSGLLLWLAAWLLDRISSASAQAEQPASQQAIVAAPPMGESAVAPAETGAATVQPAAASTPAADPVADVTVQLHFSESSWVEIYDAANRRLIYDIGQPGQTRTVAGVAPLRVTLGVASAVAVDVNQQSIPVPRRSGRDAARFTIWPDGSVR